MKPFSDKPVLYYVHDPMCSWCWAMAPVLGQLLRRLPPEIEVRRLLGGLAPDTNEPMPEELREMVQSSWRRIQQHVPNTKLNFAFWTECIPRRATYAACRAVIAARSQGGTWEAPMNTAIQRAYYTQARNPSDEATLIALAGEIGLEVAQFREALQSESVQQELEAEIALAREMDVESFPALVFQDARGYRPIPIDYRDPEPMLQAIATAMRKAEAQAGARAT
ncbi:DSBA oxidoreductase [Thioalkalivibrio nitratireducens DSM 14787]|uniref:DSBA oxidoreductase n=1 Tax=Thioalkalivibrio nitratireducens (strain DSM 14787 / UNIQEM 213 / ALEN2) TaxID=1255043 RepID=L0DW76_THIND|nr:DsbA family protein [Thioalkalivibrio nitratireducens]AGA33267.1 DSBA oxidoreductase [Thioalkalivibrio nitratireducens DSM 14787]